MPEEHAKLSASGSSTWLNCTASSRICKDIPDTTSPYAEEGTKAHDIAEKCLIKGSDAPDTHPELQLYLDHIDEHTNDNTILRVEERVEFNEFVPEGFGTVDGLIIDRANNVAHVMDLKWGKGVKVDAEENSQLMLYGLGALQEYQFEFDIDQVHLHIIQPRLDHISEWSISTKDLLDWGENIVKPAAQEAWEGESLPVAGKKQCKWCRAKAVCRARAVQLLLLPEAAKETLTVNEISQLLPVVEATKTWASELQAYAFNLANDGQTIPAYKLVAGRSVRKLISDAGTLLTEHHGLKESDVYDTKLKGIGAIEKALGGKKKATPIMEQITTKPEGKPTLVPVTDKREEINTVDANDFEIG